MNKNKKKENHLNQDHYVIENETSIKAPRNPLHKSKDSVSMKCINEAKTSSYNQINMNKNKKKIINIKTQESHHLDLCTPGMTLTENSIFDPFGLTNSVGSPTANSINSNKMTNKNYVNKFIQEKKQSDEKQVVEFEKENSCVTPTVEDLSKFSATNLNCTLATVTNHFNGIKSPKTEEEVKNNNHNCRKVNEDYSGYSQTISYNPIWTGQTSYTNTMKNSHINVIDPSSKSNAQRPQNTKK